MYDHSSAGLFLVRPPQYCSSTLLVGHSIIAQHYCTTTLLANVHHHISPCAVQWSARWTKSVGDTHWRRTWPGFFQRLSRKLRTFSRNSWAFISQTRHLDTETFESVFIVGFFCVFLISNTINLHPTAYIRKRESTLRYPYSTIQTVFQLLLVQSIFVLAKL